MLGPKATRIVLRVLIHLIAIVAAFVWLLPYMGVFMASIRPLGEIIRGWWNFEEFNPTLENFFGAWNHPTVPLSKGMINSLIVAVPATFIPLLVGALAAYAFSRFDFPVRDLLFLTIVLLMALPPQAIGIPLFLLMVRLGLVDKFPGLILFHSANALPWIILFLRNYLETVPRDFEDVARVDGASDIQIFFRVVLPIMGPALLSILALQFTWVWNDFFFALILIYSPDKYLISQRVPFMKGEYHVPWGLLCAGSVIMTSIPVLLYVILQKYFIRGIVGGTIRG